MAHNGRSVLADPTRLKPFVHDDGKDDGKDLVQVVIETPKGSRNKYAFDPQQKIFILKRVLPAGMTFPYDFGFVPSTKAGDSDPIDVLVLMDEPAFPGCALDCRLIGVIEGEQVGKEGKNRNDRLVATAIHSHRLVKIRDIDEIDAHFCRELESFFVNYHKLSGEQYRVLDIRGPKTARRLVKEAMSR